MWAFSLGPPPEDDEGGEGQAEEMDDEAVQKEAEDLKNAIEQGGGKDTEPTEEDDRAEASKEDKQPESNTKGREAEQEGESAGKETESTKEETEKANDDNDDPPEQAPDTPENEKATEDTSKQANKRTWASYLPSIPYRNKGQASKPTAEEKPSAEDEKAQNEANTKKWSSYLPTGKGFSSYVPNVQVPETKDVVNAFKTTHARDPNKSYAEQLYDFSKTPVGAGTIAGKHILMLEDMADELLTSQLRQLRQAQAMRPRFMPPIRRTLQHIRPPLNCPQWNISPSHTLAHQLTSSFLKSPMNS